MTESLLIPHDQIHPDTLQGVIEEFVTRHGTDYGEQETTLAMKVTQVTGQLQRGEAFIVYDPVTQSINLLTRAQVKQAGLS